jgi:hypothetical protein
MDNKLVTVGRFKRSKKEINTELSKFEIELRILINKMSIDSLLDISDFQLARNIVKSLKIEKT